LKYLTFYFLLFVYCFGFSQQAYYFRHYQVENGLSNNAVICSLQDRKGFLWFGTKDGLNRFDGYSFKTFRNDPDDSTSLGSNFIHCLFEDFKGVLWAGTENGLYHYDATTEKFIRLPSSNNMPIRSVQSDNFGNLWFIMGFTLAKFNPLLNTTKVYNIDNFFIATSICLSADKNIWVSTTNGYIEKYNIEKDNFTGFNVFKNTPASISRWIEQIYPNSRGQLWIGTSNQGAKLFTIATSAYENVLTYNTDHTEIFARNFVEASDDECWIATETGIFIYYLKSKKTINLSKNYNDAYSLSDNAVYTFCKDREGGIWAGTYFGGINYFPDYPISFHKYFPITGKNTMSGNVIREIHQDPYKNLWIGTEDGGLNKMNLRTETFTPFTPSDAFNKVSYTNIHGLLITGDELWIGTFEHGLDVMNIQTNKIIRHFSEGDGLHDLKSNFIYCLYQDNNGAVMVGTTRGAYVYDRQHNNFNKLPGTPLMNWYSCILKDNNGIIWAGTYGNGINYYNTITKDSGNLRYDPSDKKSLSSNRVNSIFQDHQGTLWFATESGLCKYLSAEKSFKRYTTRNGFPTNFILCMLEDSFHRLWISTSRGLVCFNPNTEQLKVYTKENGLLTDQFNFNSAFRDKNGQMYFGTAKGFISFYPEEEKHTAFSPPIYITGFQVNNETIDIHTAGAPLQQSILYTNNITLNHDQATFSIDFASLTYTSPEMSNYTYVMEGLQKDWVYLKQNRKVYFTELAPGNYTFKVRATNYNGQWNNNTAVLHITILPPWWVTRWAYTVYILLFLLLAFLLSKNYHERIKEKNRRKIEQLEILKNKELYEAKMDFFANITHEIKTPLTLIKGPLEKLIRKLSDVPDDIRNYLHIMEKNTNRLVALTNEILDFRQTEIKGFSINFVLADISENIKEITDSFRILAEQKNIQFYLNEPEDKIMAEIDLEAFEKILSNLLSNAIKYAKNKITIQLLPLVSGNNSFSIEIANDGYLIPADQREKIFEPFFRLKETEKQKGTGIGLSLAKSLTELHKGTLCVKESGSNLNIFSLTMPVHQNTLSIGSNHM